MEKIKLELSPNETFELLVILKVCMKGLPRHLKIHETLLRIIYQVASSITPDQIQDAVAEFEAQKLIEDTLHN